MSTQPTRVLYRSDGRGLELESIEGVSILGERQERKSRTRRETERGAGTANKTAPSGDNFEAGRGACLG